jgi:hypothetical protein
MACQHPPLIRSALAGRRITSDGCPGSSPEQNPCTGQSRRNPSHFLHFPHRSVSARRGHRAPAPVAAAGRSGPRSARRRRRLTRTTVRRPSSLLPFLLLPPPSTTLARERHHEKVGGGLQWRLQADGGGAVAGPFIGARIPLACERAAVERSGRGALCPGRGGVLLPRASNGCPRESRGTGAALRWRNFAGEPEAPFGESLSFSPSLPYFF